MSSTENRKPRRSETKTIVREKPIEIEWRKNERKRGTRATEVVGDVKGVGNQ